MEEIENENELEIGFLTYNGLNKPAMVAGIPLMLAISLLASVVFICFPAFMLLGKVAGLIPATFIIGTFLIAKVICENDPNAISVVGLKLKGMMRYKFKSILAFRG